MNADEHFKYLLERYQHQKDVKRNIELEKQRRKHDWRIALFNVLGGAIAGLITSVIFWLATT